MKTLIIDNYDSFTFNLFQMIAEVNGEEPIVVANDEVAWDELKKLRFDNIVISPGPGRPENERDFGVCRNALAEATVPLLGVCLGHEGIGHLFGGAIAHAPEVMHGRLSPIYHDNSALFKGIPQEFMVVRYHSLMVADGLPDCLERIAWTGDNVLMGLRHRSRPMWGVQFHPESICTEYGRQLLENFRDITHGIGGNGNGLKAFVPFTPRRREQAGEFEIRSRKLNTFYDSERVFVNLFGAEPRAFWLDSSRTEPGLSRFSYMGAPTGPLSATIRYTSASRDLTIEEGGAVLRRTQSIFDYLDRELARRRCYADELPFDFNAGFVGYFGYELKQECGTSAEHESRCPDAAFVFADRMIAFDHQEKATYLVSLVPQENGAWAEEWFDETQRKLEELAPLPDLVHENRTQPTTFHLERNHAAYLESIRECLQEIHEGETYEVCLTNQISTTTAPDPLLTYRTLRSINPAPYAAFIRLEEMAIVCSSPERFLLSDRDGWVESKPIKGTRKRAATERENEAIREELRTCTKDRAENLMIVDLLRNDLGRVCEVGSVHVPKLMNVESYATVHQLVSTIRGHLRQDRDVTDCIRAAFPGGSMTGAPKLRTMEIIDRLELSARGVYSGSIGFLGVNGTADLNIVIRTIVMTPGLATMGVGGAIVALSDPEEEFEETLVKARAQMNAIVLAAHGSLNAENYSIEGI
ncbi:MAG: aminodeoxychorismate synthase component I [Bacteroidetes bacterium]|nr:aminodeoxychorismate synthase component I [Bacteroidota bacterium]